MQGSAQVSISHAAWVQVSQRSQVGQPVQRPRDISVVEVPRTTNSVYTHDMHSRTQSNQDYHALSISLARSLSLIHTNKHTFSLTLSFPLALVVHALVIVSCVCVCVVCALNLKHPRITCPTIVLCVLLVLLSATVLLLSAAT